MEQIRLCMTDIDGTFLRQDKSCPALNVEAVKELRKKGIKFGIATGRPATILPKLFEEWGLAGEVDYIVGSNGAEVVDCQLQTTKEQFFLSAEKLHAITKQFKHFDASLCVYEGATLVADKSTFYYRQRCEAVHLQQKITCLEDYLQHSYPKMLIVSSPQEQQRILAYQSELGCKEFKMVASSDTLLEVIDPELSKVKGILQLCEQLQIEKEQVLCFGDEMNDFEMLSTFTGVCVSNAIEEIKAISAYQTTSCDEGGVGRFLIDYLL